MSSSGSSYRPMCWGDAGQQVVAGEEAAGAAQSRRVGLLQVQADVAGGVAGRPDGAQAAARQVQQLAGGDPAVGQGRVEAGQPARAVRVPGAQERRDVLGGGAPRAELRGQVAVPALGRVGAGAAHDGGVRRVHRDPRPGRLADLRGQAVVVGVVVRDDHTAYVLDGDAAQAEPGGQCGPGGGVVPAGVDQDRAVVGVQEVDEGAAEGVVGDRDLDAPDTTAVLDHRRFGHLRGGHGRLVSRRRMPTITRTGFNGRPSARN